MNYTCTAQFKKNYLSIIKDSYQGYINKLLTKASYNGHLEVVKELIKCGANVHANDYALRWASYNGHLEVVKYLKEVISKLEVTIDT